MNKFINRRLSLLLIIVLVLQVAAIGGFSREAAAADNVDVALSKTIDYCSTHITGFGGSANDWLMLGLRWADSADKKLQVEVSPEKPTDYARVILGSIARGDSGDVVKGYIDTLEEKQTVAGEVYGYFSSIPGNEETLNQTIWPVIALDFAEINGFSVNYDREKAISYICSKQDASGGFDESGWGVDVDSTAHALIVLAPDYKEGEENVKEVVNKALDYLKGKQLPSGAFDNWGASPDSTAAVVEALIALGKDPSSAEWITENGNNMIDALLSYQSAEGWFVYSWEAGEYNDPTKPNKMTTYHALLALTDLGNGKSKYHNKLPDLDALQMMVKDPAGYSLDSDANLQLNFNNLSGSQADILTIFGLYKTDTRQMLYYLSLPEEIAAGDTAEFSSGFSIPETGEYEVRIYVWDNWENKTPLFSPTIIPVTE